MNDKDSARMNIDSSIDAIGSDLEVVAAIVDAALVLSALERVAPTRCDGPFLTGGGHAEGYRLRDRSLPDLLRHARDLADRAHRGTLAVSDAMTIAERPSSGPTT